MGIPLKNSFRDNLFHNYEIAVEVFLKAEGSL